jgi:hypothetical protein
MHAHECETFRHTPLCFLAGVVWWGGGGEQETRDCGHVSPLSTLQKTVLQKTVLQKIVLQKTVLQHTVSVQLPMCCTSCVSLVCHAQVPLSVCVPPPQPAQ